MYQITKYLVRPNTACNVMNGQGRHLHTAASHNPNQDTTNQDCPDVQADLSLLSAGNPCDQMTRYTEFVTIFSSTYSTIF